MTPAPHQGRRPGRPAIRRAAESVVTRLIGISGVVAILILAAITVFLVLNASRAISEVGLWEMISGTDWYPTSKNPSFGFLPAEVGSVWVTIVAVLLCMPLGIAAAIYISEFAGRRVQESAKSLIEFMAAVPSVVLGLIGVYLLAPRVRVWFDLDTGLTAFTAGLVVGVMTLPTLISIAEDAMHAVPSDLRTGSLALGNTRWQTVYKVISAVGVERDLRGRDAGDRSRHRRDDGRADARGQLGRDPAHSVRVGPHDAGNHRR